MAKGKLGKGNVSRIKNKQKRVQVYNIQKKEGDKAARAARKQRQKDAEALGEEAPRPVQRTLDNTREIDQTMVQPGDEEVAFEDSIDEFAEHFAGRTPPRTVITTSRYPSKQLLTFLEIVVGMLPNSEYRQRGAIPIKSMVSASIKHGFTNLLIFTEKAKKVHGVYFIKLPGGPTARFKLSSLMMPQQISGHGRPTGHRPELILNNFSTRLGHRLGRMLACLVPYDPQFRGRQVVTMHNQRDFIFVRQHRYIFEEKDKEERARAKAKAAKIKGVEPTARALQLEPVAVRLQELGPRFTLKLKWLQLGTFDTQHGEYEWKHRPELDTSRRRFHI